MKYTEITPEQQAGYLQDPNTCPFCASEKITAGHFEAGDTEAWRGVQCLNPKCQMTWTEMFDLTLIDNAFKTK